MPEYDYEEMKRKAERHIRFEQDPKDVDDDVKYQPDQRGEPVGDARCCGRGGRLDASAATVRTSTEPPSDTRVRPRVLLVDHDPHVGSDMGDAARP